MTKRQNLIDIARACVIESRKARTGQGRWADLSPVVRAGNARSYLAAAADYRAQAQGA